MNLDFINVVINNCDKIDAFVKFFNVCTKKYHDNKDDCVLGLFALKCKYFKKFRYNANNNISAEVDFAMYIKKTIDNNKILSIKNLSLECCFADDLRILIV